MTTGAALGGAIRDVRATWRPRTAVATAAFAVASLAPLVVGGARTADLAAGLYLACAAVGLAFVVGVAGLPSLAQGAFVASGAVTSAHLIAAGVPTAVAALAAALVAGASAAVVGIAFAQLPRAGIAAATWIVSWLLAFGLQSITWLLGGSQGIVVPDGPSPAQHYELALALTALAAAGFAALARSPIGLGLTAAREREPAALALGVPIRRLRVTAFAASGVVAGLAGGLGVQLAGVGDAAQYSSFLSFKLFVVVLVGGALAPLGAPAGVVVLGVLSVLADLVGSLEHIAASRSHQLLAAIMLLGIVSLGWDGIVRPERPRRRPGPGAMPPRAEPAPLRATALGKRYGEVTAVDEIDIEVDPGRITALVGPNGSGKTTMLRMLAGTVQPDHGTISRPGAVVRTLQSTAVFPTLTALEHVLVASAGRRRRGGFMRSLLATPQARAEDAAFTADALRVLERFGLRSDVPASELPVSDQRALMLAAAYATGASVLLVDEPTAGASHTETERIAGLLAALRDEGLALLVVEHNVAVVRRLADRVVALDAGRVVSDGPPDAAF